MILKKLLELVKRDNRRSIRNYLLEPKLQLRLAFYIGVNTLLVVVAASVFVVFMYQPLFESLINATNESAPEIFQLLEENTTSTFSIILAFTLTHILVMTMLVIWYSHRFVGPIVAFRRHTKSLIEGKNSSRVNLRKGDAFTALADDLNQLAESLEK